MESPSLENDDIQGTNNVEKCTKSQHVGSSPMEMLNEHLNTNLLNFHINDNDDCDIQFFQHAGSISRQSQSQTDQFSTAVDDQRIKHNDMEMRKSCINVNLSQAFSNSGNFFAPFSFPDNGMDFDEPQFFPGNCVGYLETILEETDEEIDDEEGCSGINWWMANSDTDTDSVICLDNANQLKSPRGNFTTAELSKEYLPFLDPDRERILYGLHSQSSTQVFHQLENINASVSDPVNLTSGNSLTDHVNVNCTSERTKEQERNDRSKEEAFELFNAHFYPADVRTINNDSTSSSLFESNSKEDPSCFEDSGDLHSAENINEEFNYTSSDNDSEDDSEETSSDDSKTDGIVLAEFSLSSSFPVNNRFRNSVGDKSKSGLRSFRSFDSLNSLTGYDILVPKLNTSLTNSCCADSAFLRHDEEDLADFKMNEDLMYENKTPVPPPHGGTKNLTKQMSSEDLSEDSGIGVEGAKSSAFLQSSNLLFSNPNNVQNQHDDSKVNSHSSSTVPVPLADFALNPFVYSSASASEESSRNSSLYYAYDVRLQDESSSVHHDHEIHRVHANNPFFTDIMDDEVKRKTDEALRNNTPLLPPTLSKSNSPDREITDLTDSFGSQEILSDNLSDSELTPTPYLESPSQNDSMNDLHHEADQVEDGSSPVQFLHSSTGDEKPKVDSESSMSESDDKVVIVGTQKKIAEKAKSLTNLSNLATLRLSSADNGAENIEDEQTNSKKSSFIDSDLSDTDERARSLEFLLDQESSSTNTQNNLRKNSLPAVSEHELRIQRSLRKLNVPEWFTKHSYSTSTMSESFRNKVSPGAKRLDVSYKNDGGRDWKTLSSSKTPSLSSLHGSGRFKHRSLTSYVPFNHHDATSPTSTEAPSPLKPADPSRPTYVKKPYLGWRSQEKLDNILPSSFVRSGSSSSSSNFRMSVYRPPAERLAAEALATSAFSSRVVSESPKVEYISKSKNTQPSNLGTTDHPKKFSDTQTDNLQTNTSASHPFQLSIRKRLDMNVANSPLLKESELRRVPGTRHQLWIESSFLG